MLRSMTGFGSGSFANEVLDITAEIRTVNSRYLDIAIRSRLGLGDLEPRIRSILRQRLHRGKIELSLKISFPNTSDQNVSLNRPLADEYYKIFTQILDRYGLERRISLDHFLAAGNVIETDDRIDDRDALMQGIGYALDNALSSLVRMRNDEGQHIEQDIANRIDLCERTLLEIEETAHELPARFYDRLRARLTRLASRAAESAPEIDPERVAQEVALLVDRADITEEIIRFHSHIKQFREYLRTEGEAVGRSLEFVLQEMHREANTIASKSADSSVSRLSVQIRAELEKIREQIQNVE